MHSQNPGFPKRDGISQSCWLQGVQGDPLLRHRTTPQLPVSADIVIIGSGMTGTLAAKYCIEAWPEKSVVVLEARDFCSGATGRNAGHCKPDQWRGFSDYAKMFGPQESLRILENEGKTWSDLVTYVKENNVDCDLWVGDTLDVPVTTEAAAEAKDTFNQFQAAGGDVSHIRVTHDPEEAKKISRIKHAKACYAWQASTLYPWKLAAHVMREALKKGVNLQTHTLVRTVVRHQGTPNRWLVHSERGEIACSQVIHATNAYCPAIEESMRGLIRPSPHMCNEISPPPGFRGPKALKNSYGVLFPNGGLITINPRIPLEGTVLFGGSNPGQAGFERWLQDHPERWTDDGLSNFPSVTKAVQEFTSSQMMDWPNTKTPSEHDKHSWSGIIGLSADTVPFVGELPGLPGQWICAGHHGHGMARIFTAVPGLVQLMRGRSWAETGLPASFQITPLRMSRLKKLSASTGAVYPRL